MGRQAGIREAQLRDLAAFEDSPEFTAREKLVIRLAVAMTETPSTISDALFGELRLEFSEAQLAELSVAIAWENYRARFNRTFDIQAANFSKGAYCPMPERHIPAG